jgi:homoserine dehydrogenase
MKSDPPPKAVRLGLLGFGTVGQALVRLVEKEGPRLLRRHALDLRVVAIGNRRMEAKRVAWAGPAVRWTSDLGAVVADPEVDVVVELLGGLEPAGSLLRQALEAGKSVVTANKLLLAHEGVALAELAAERGAALGLEASVAGGIPILRAVRESFAGDTILAVTGILNGTCNFILTEMEKTGRPYESVLAEAQALGYVEADPRSDVEGDDAAYKLTLLSRMAFGQNVAFSDIAKEGITRLLPCDFVYARQLGRSLRQLATCRLVASGRLLLSVRTHLVSKESILAKVEGPFNAVRVEGESGGDFVFYGRGAGGNPTATAVLSDIVELARRGPQPGVPPLGFARFQPAAPAGPDEFVSPFYLRFVVRDRPGIIADISRCLADHDINIDAIFQAPYADKEALPFVITLEPVSQRQLDGALSEIGRLSFHAEAPLAFPMTG